MLIHTSMAGHEISIIDRNNRRWRFEDHRYCGPVAVDRNGDPLKEQPEDESPFWEAVECWYQQGKPTKETGVGLLAKWVRPTMKEMIHIGGGRYMLDPSLLQEKSTEGE